MVYKKLLFTKQLLVDSILRVYEEDGSKIDNFLTRVDTNSYSVPEWLKITKRCLGNVQEKTVQSNLRRCHAKFTAYRADIKRMVTNASRKIARKVSKDKSGSMTDKSIPLHDNSIENDEFIGNQSDGVNIENSKCLEKGLSHSDQFISTKIHHFRYGSADFYDSGIDVSETSRQSSSNDYDFTAVYDSPTHTDDDYFNNNAVHFSTPIRSCMKNTDDSTTNKHVHFANDAVCGTESINIESIAHDTCNGIAFCKSNDTKGEVVELKKVEVAKKETEGSKRVIFESSKAHCDNSIEIEADSCDNEKLLIKIVEEEMPVDTPTEDQFLFPYRKMRPNWPIIGPSFIMPKSFWQTYWTGAKSLIINYADEFNKEFSKHNPYCNCVLSITWAQCSENSKSNLYFNAEAKCNNSYCTKFKFIVQDKISVDDFKDVTVYVLMQDKIRHNIHEINSRWVRKLDRNELAVRMQAISPKQTEYALRGAADKKKLKAGNFNGVPSLGVLHKINSDYKKRNDLDKDHHKFIEKLIVLYRENYGDVIKGYIQLYMFFPLNLILFKETQIEYLLKQKQVFLNMDATGSVGCEPPDSIEKSTLYYYVMVLPGSENFSPLEVLESYQTVHTETMVTFVLRYFVDQLKRMNASKRIDKFESDFSLVILKSASTAFNQMDLYELINLMYKALELQEVEEASIVEEKDEEIAEKEQKEEENRRKEDMTVNDIKDNVSSEGEKEGSENYYKFIFDRLTVLHICSSHLIKTVRKKLKSIFPDKEKHKNHRLAASILISEMIHSSDIESATPAFKQLITIYGCHYKTTNFDKILNRDTEDTDFDSGFDLQDEELPEGPAAFKSKVKSSLYYQHFCTILKDVVEKSEFSDEENNYYSDDLIKYFMEHIIPYFPLWSAAGISKFGLARSSNATAENHIKIHKHNLFNGETKIPIPRMIMKTEKLIDDKLFERELPNVSARKRKNALLKIPSKKNDYSEPKKRRLICKAEECEDSEEKAQGKTKKGSKRKRNSKTSGKVKKGGKKLEAEYWCRKKPQKKGNRYFPASNKIIVHVKKSNSAKNKQAHKILKAAKRIKLQNTRNFLKKQINPKIKSITTKPTHEYKELKIVKKIKLKNSSELTQPTTYNIDLGIDLAVDSESKNCEIEEKDLEIISEFKVDSCNDKIIKTANQVKKKSLRKHWIKTINSIKSAKLLLNKTFKLEKELNVFVITYPTGFPKLEKEINGFVITEVGFNTLHPYIGTKNEWLDDSVINSFFSLLPEIARKRKIPLLCFDTFFFTKIIGSNRLSEGFMRWGFQENVLSQDVWLLPVNQSNSHWSLLMVMLNERSIIYFDSAHGSCPRAYINGLCTFIKRQSRDKINWNTWTLYEPKDFPSQHLKGRTAINENKEIVSDESGGNCGVHTCLRGLIIATGDYLQDYSEKDMDVVRMNIANIIYYAKPNARAASRKIKNKEVIFFDHNEVEDQYAIEEELVDELQRKSQPPFGKTVDFCSFIQILTARAKETRGST